MRTELFLNQTGEVGDKNVSALKSPDCTLSGSEWQALNVLSSTVILSLESQTLLRLVTITENTDGRHSHQGRLTSGQKPRPRPAVTLTHSSA